jgi:hypothetical protein
MSILSLDLDMTTSHWYMVHIICYDRADVDILDEKMQKYIFIIGLLTFLVLIWIIDVYLHIFR